METVDIHEIEWNDEKVARLWDYYSKTPPYSEDYFTKEVGKNILHETSKVLGNLDNKVILDFGCGPAFLMDHISNLNIQPKKYIGLDFSEKSVENIKNKKNISFDHNGVFVQQLPSSIESNSIDICFLIEVIEHLEDDYLDGTLKEIFRVLKPGGKLIITTPNSEDLDQSKNFCPDCGSIYHKWQHVRSFTSHVLEETLLQHDFKTVTVEELTFIGEKTSFFKKLKLKLRRLSQRKNGNLFGIFIK
ncbi:MAG: methyltransferase domain-containing protein [Helicobacteraceae bacterium]|nr:methyltransferase domain-containing protein [Helicobacteraceae bacterium]